MRDECVEAEKKRVKSYAKSVYFFSVFGKILEIQGIKVKIEAKFKQISGPDCYPDFYCGGDVKVVFEHKGSISTEEKWIKKEIHDTERYLSLRPKDAVDNVILLFPEKQIGPADNVFPVLKSQLCIWGYDLNLDRCKLSFKQHYNEVKNTSVSKLLEAPISFDIIWCSLRKFLREDPPVVYTSSFLCNNVLRSFIDPWREPSESFNVPLKRVVEEAQKWYPGTRDANQITTNRVRRALEFLNSIGWVEYPNSENGITVKGAKRLRDQIVSDILCVEYCKEDEGEQSILEEFVD